MKKTCYNLTAFNLNDALSGGLCMALNSAFTPTGPVCDYIPASPNPESTPYVPRDYMKKNEYVLGAGVCKYESPYLLINIENDTYVFDENGNGVTEGAKYYKLWMATVVSLDGDELDEKYEGTPDVGLDVDIYTHSFNEGGYLNIINEQTTKRVSNLTTRDKFATSILQGILGKISDPAALSISEIQFYCEAAYKWADSMLLSAASRRSECSQYWKNDTMYDVSGNPVIMYVESWRNLVDSEGHGYNSEEEAVEDGWVFYPAVDDNIPTLESTIKKKLDEVTEAISNIESGGGGGGGGTDVSGIVTQLTAIKNKLEDFYTYRGTYSYPLYIQNKRGDSSNNPIYISGGGSTDVSGIVSALNTLNSKNLFGRGGSSSSPLYVRSTFPTKQELPQYTYNETNSFLVYNNDSNIGYINKAALADYISTSILSSVLDIHNLLSQMTDVLQIAGVNISYVKDSSGYITNFYVVPRLYNESLDGGFGTISSANVGTIINRGYGSIQSPFYPVFKLFKPYSNVYALAIGTVTYMGHIHYLEYNRASNVIAVSNTMCEGQSETEMSTIQRDIEGVLGISITQVTKEESFAGEPVRFRIDV